MLGVDQRFYFLFVEGEVKILLSKHVTVHKFLSDFSFVLALVLFSLNKLFLVFSDDLLSEGLWLVVRGAYELHRFALVYDLLLFFVKTISFLLLLVFEQGFGVEEEPSRLSTF